MNKISVGRVAEDKVKNYYLKNNYHLITQNFEYYSSHKGRVSEIDLIFTKNQIIIFLEVKYRSNTNVYGSALEQITNKKIQNIYKCYRYFINKYEYRKYSNFLARFDVAIIENQKLTIIPNAYNFDG